MHIFATSVTLSNGVPIENIGTYLIENDSNLPEGAGQEDFRGYGFISSQIMPHLKEYGSSIKPPQPHG